MTYHFRLLRTDGSPADPPTYRSTVLSWRQGALLRASLLTDELRARVERELAAGTQVNVTAQRVGIGERTLSRWIAEGRVARRKRRRGATLRPTSR